MSARQNTPTIVECVRCSATTNGGKRCKRVTCKYFKYCYQHTRSLLGLKIAPSGIPGGGDGLFATRDFAPNETIAEYAGKVRTERQFNNEPSAYGFELKKNMVIDAVSTQSSVARWANMCRSANRQGKQCVDNNAKFVPNTTTNKVFLKVKGRKIKAGSEIFVSYGREFFKSPKKRA